MTASPDLATLGRLAEEGGAGDRAYVDGAVRIAWARERDAGRRRELHALHALLAPRSRDAHAALRASIADGSLRGRALRSVFEGFPRAERDHVVEEVLGVAYPPLDEREVDREEIAYAPSGYDEIVYALDATEGTQTFLDLGAGLGKVALLAALLGRTASGIERDPVLVARATEAAARLAVDVRVTCADVRAATLDEPDVVFMYLPFTGSLLASVLDRLAARPPRYLCAGALDAARWPGFVPAAPPRSWLHVHRRA